MPIDPASAAFIKPVLDLLKTAYSAVRRRLGKRTADQMTSWVIAELLKESPDMTAAEAELAAIEATGAKPTLELHRAKTMLKAVRSYEPIKKASRSDWWAWHGPTKRSARKRKPSPHHARPRRKRKKRVIATKSAIRSNPV